MRIVVALGGNALLRQGEPLEGARLEHGSRWIRVEAHRPGAGASAHPGRAPGHARAAHEHPLLGDRGLLEQSKPLIFVRDGAAFGLPRDKQTKRVLRAMDSRYFTILAHPSTRLLGEREACDIDMQAIVRQAKKRGCFLELDAQPDRLDLNDIYCQMARDEGVLVSVDSDAHSRYDFSYLDYGIGQARRGWLEPRDVLNTRELPELWRLLRQTMCSSRAAA